MARKSRRRKNGNGLLYGSTSTSTSTSQAFAAEYGEDPPPPPARPSAPPIQALEETIVSEKQPNGMTKQEEKVKEDREQEEELNEYEEEEEEHSEYEEEEEEHSEYEEIEDDDFDSDGFLSQDEDTPPPVPIARYEPHPEPLASANGDKKDGGDRPVRLYADGIYDLFHFGHARSLEQAKKAFPNAYLLVGCCNDATTHKYKGKTVMTEAERYESLRHCRWVDEVIPDAPWVISQEFLDKHQIDYVAHDALPYADASGAGNDVYEFVRSIGRFKETKRTEGISTSDIIMRLVKDYNEYVMRNLARGYTRKDLGVSYVKEKQLRVNMGIRKLQEKVKEHQERVGEKLNTVAKTAGVLHDEWVENADRWVSGFLEKFEEGCHQMESAIRTRIQKGLLPQQPKRRPLLKTSSNPSVTGSRAALEIQPRRASQ